MYPTEAQIEAASHSAMVWIMMATHYQHKGGQNDEDALQLFIDRFASARSQRIAGSVGIVVLARGLSNYRGLSNAARQRRSYLLTQYERLRAGWPRNSVRAWFSNRDATPRGYTWVQDAFRELTAGDLDAGDFVPTSSIVAYAIDQGEDDFAEKIATRLRQHVRKPGTPSKKRDPENPKSENCFDMTWLEEQWPELAGISDWWRPVRRQQA